MSPGITHSAALAGRILLALIFVISGYGKITGFDGTVGYIASKALPFPQVAAIIAIVLEVGGGLMLATGFKARWAALALAIYSLATAALFHDFWNADAVSKLDLAAHFWKNVAICGGMLTVFAFGAGRYSVDEAIPSSNRQPSGLAV